MELHPLPLDTLLLRAFTELERRDAIFDLPRAKWYTPPADLDLSCTFRTERAATPVGPAAGPQSQMVQNIVLSWLAGARVVELKTVQVDDRLVIPRPCIDARTLGYNVEWSQELRVDDALREYVGAWMMIRILQEAQVMDLPPGAGDVLFDMSVGYDLQGIRTRKVSDFVRSMCDATAVIDGLRPLLRGRFAKYRDLDFDPRVAAGITLSTFHGCPAGEIEGICEYLLRELGTHVVIKLNPTLLGYETVEGIVRGELGYEHVQLDPAAFEHDLKWEECQQIVERLEGVAQACGLTLGVKFTNTLVVKNHDTFFPNDPTMYLSGAALHVLSTQLAAKFRARFGDRFGISFSAGIDQKNFAEAAACDLVPITTCTDLLRAGGYGRMSGYLTRLGKLMRDKGVATRGDWILTAEGAGAELAPEVLGAELGGKLAAYLGEAGAKDARAWLEAEGAAERYPELVARAGAANLARYAQAARQDPRYGFEKNKKPPRKVGSKLWLFDCISCDKCVPVCPNDANFTLEIAPIDQASEEVVLGDDRAIEVRAAMRYTAERSHQLANFADWCNECGNCDVFCPEDGGPYVIKPRFFSGEASYREAPQHDGFYLERVLPDGWRMRGRIDGLEYTLVRVGGQPDRFEDDSLALELDPEAGTVLGARPFFRAKPGHVLPTWRYLAMRALLQAVLDAGAVTPVGALAAVE
ncbi:MAG: glutamate synthase [Planctomycetes bacterium]|nr:glutamate synthase [Planctomycetota bacterium]